MRTCGPGKPLNLPSACFRALVSMVPILTVPALQVGLGEGPTQGPFGLQCGMTKAQVMQIVGREAVKENKGDSLILATAPKPHSAFEEYVLIFSPDKGLLKIAAVGKDISTNGFGSEVHDAFTEIRDILSRTYGAGETHDFLESGSIWNEDRDWMMGLLKKERVLSAYWGVASKLPNHITAMALTAIALSTEKGYLRLAYEFEGWDAYVDSKRAKEGEVF